MHLCPFFLTFLYINCCAKQRERERQRQRERVTDRQTGRDRDRERERESERERERACIFHKIKCFFFTVSLVFF